MSAGVPKKRLVQARGDVLDRDFFARDTRRVARELLGKYLVHRLPDGALRSGRIVETEAYHGPNDRASHASRGPTPRTRIMFGPPGYAYVYLIYGMYHCLNFVTGEAGFPAAVLVRGIDRTEGFDADAVGPGRLCRALEICRETHDGLDVTADDSPLWVEDRGESLRGRTSPRIGVPYAGDWKEKPWRYYVPGSVTRAGRRIASGKRS
jgi:DNA-3-methyladenine glycosylase